MAKGKYAELVKEILSKAEALRIAEREKRINKVLECLAAQARQEQLRTQQMLGLPQTQQDCRTVWLTEDKVAEVLTRSLECMPHQILIKLSPPDENLKKTDKIMGPEKKPKLLLERDYRIIEYKNPMDTKPEPKKGFPYINSN